MSGAVERSGPAAHCLPLVDVFKALAAQLIVLHHLAWYGPMTDVAAGLSPLVDRGQDWLAEYGRYAVATFLAIGGYLAAQAMQPRSLFERYSPGALILKRYARLVGPYAAALVIAMLCAAAARKWMSHDSIGATPQPEQVIAHLFLLHDLLDYEALSAGVWYVAIDFQLYALLVGLLWLAAQLGRRVATADFWAAVLVAGVATVSLAYFSRDTRWDESALYFFGIYAFGVGCGWAARTARPHRLLAGIAVLGLMALAFDFRPRLAIALLTALALGIAQVHLRCNGSRLVAVLGRSAYALFLVHFPVCLLVNALFQRFDPADPLMNFTGVAVAWIASNFVALLFYRHVEQRVVPWLDNYISCRRVAGQRG